MKNKIEYLQKKIESEIPVSKAMKINIDYIDNEMIRLTAPLELNKNGKNTGFAGSIYSIMALAGWIFVTGCIIDLEFDAACVIHKGNIDYIKPVVNDIEVICKPLSKEQWDKFVLQLNREARAKINLNANIFHENMPIVNFDGEYVAWRI